MPTYLKYTTALFMMLAIFKLQAQDLPNFHSEHQNQSEFYHQLGLDSEAEFDQYHGKLGNNPIAKTSACTLKKKVYGWYPYWMGTSYTGYDFGKLSTFSYFSYEVNPSTGNYSSIHSWKTTNSVALAQAAGCRVELSATLFGASNNTTFLTNLTARQTFIDSIISLVQFRNADGVNIDFEGISGSQRNNFTSFMQDLSNQLKAQVAGATLTMALYSVDWNNVFDIPALDPYVDEFIIMGYGYYYSGSTTSGPNAPLYSGSRWAPYNLTRSVLYYLGQGITASKLLIGLPYYGNEYTTSSNAVPTTTTGFVGARTYSYAQNVLEGVQPKVWDDHSFSPVYVFQNAGVWRQSWSEDVQSMWEKFDLVSHRNIGGIGIWALGYDDGHQDLWDLIEYKFSDCGPDVCADTLYDSGGPMGNYRNNEDNHWTITAPNGAHVKAEFIQFDLEANFDYLYIFDGPTTASPLIGQYSGTTAPPVAISSGDALTFRFTSDGATLAAGYKLKWECDGAPLFADTIRLDHNDSANIDCGKPFHVFYDSDAGAGGNYLDNERHTMVFCASDPSKNIRLSFDMLSAPVQLDLRSTTTGNDYLYVWDGPDTNAAIKALYTGTTSSYPQPGTVVSSGRCLTTRLQSDASGNASGFKATLRCKLPPTNLGTFFASNAAPLQFYDSGGPSGNYSNNTHTVITYCPTSTASANGEKIWAEIGQIGIEENYDYLHVFDGNSTSARLIGTYTGNNLNANDLQTIIATNSNASGCLTFEFYSDGGTTASGWAATMKSGNPRLEYGNNSCSNATLINVAGSPYAGSTTLATGKPNAEDPSLNISLLSLPECSGANAITRLENSIWYKFSTPSTICPQSQINLMLENISCQNSIPGGNGAQIAIYEVNTCQTGSSWGNPVYCSDKMLQSVPLNIASILQPSQTYYILIDGFAGQHCNLDLILMGNITGCILPIELVDFGGFEQNGTVLLNWETQAEQNNQGFFVQRMIDNSFEEIGFVASNANVNGNGNYSFTDPSYERNAINYYRLRQLDSNGASHFHRVIEIRTGNSINDLAPIFFPNPFRNMVSIRFPRIDSEAGEIELFDVQGKIQFQRIWNAGNQPNELEINTENLATGIYYYRVRIGNNSFTGKLLRQ